MCARVVHIYCMDCDALTLPGIAPTYVLRWPLISAESREGGSARCDGRPEHFPVPLARTNKNSRNADHCSVGRLKMVLPFHHRLECKRVHRRHAGPLCAMRLTQGRLHPRCPRRAGQIRNHSRAARPCSIWRRVGIPRVKMAISTLWIGSSILLFPRTRRGYVASSVHMPPHLLIG